MAVDHARGIDQVPSRFLLDPSFRAVLVRIFGWSSLTVLAVFLINNVLTIWLRWPGAFGGTHSTADARTWGQTGLYVISVLIAVGYVVRNRSTSLRTDRNKVRAMSSFLIRAAFWSVLLIGLVDVTLSFLRGEELLGNVVGASFAQQLMRTEFRGTYIHFPLVLLAIGIAAFVRSIGIVWLSLLVVGGELLIVMFRFVFSYEQVYMSDLVRFWFAGLFLFGCAYTLRREGHVRVDVFYAGFAPKTKGLVNAVGTLILGMPFCWVILAVGLSGETGVINSALLSFEIEGLGDGMYVLYLMTVFMGVFAVSMLIEFVGFLFNAVADFHEEPGDPDRRSAHVR